MYELLGYSERNLTAELTACCSWRKVVFMLLHFFFSIALSVFVPRPLPWSFCAAFIYSPFLQFPVNWSARGSSPAARTAQPTARLVNLYWQGRHSARGLFYCSRFPLLKISRIALNREQELFLTVAEMVGWLSQTVALLEWNQMVVADTLVLPFKAVWNLIMLKKWSSSFWVKFSQG